MEKTIDIFELVMYVGILIIPIHAAIMYSFICKKFKKSMLKKINKQRDLCPTCQGEKKITSYTQIGPYKEQTTFVCQTCMGEGIVDKVTIVTYTNIKNN